MSQEIIAFAEKRVSEAREALKSAEEDLVRIYNAFSTPPVTMGPLALHEGRLFFLDSRSGGHGHFMRVIRGNLECSCPASTYGRKCWAMNRIEWNLKIGDTSWTYSGTDDAFRRRVRPANAMSARPRDAFGSPVAATI